MGKQNTRSKSVVAKTKKGDMSSKKDFKVGDEVFIMNPEAVRQKVAVGTISRFHGSHKFHGKEIPPSWLKVDVREALEVGVPFMFPLKAAGMEFVEDAKGSSAI